ncbi:hypothetical protein [Pseudomonas fluorescens]|uniref:Uncharacterized protein n=1 Tax=Pseudomonas fluorescens TaxID=294 RepID=A0A5E7GLW6_PSEFL|nr:hypothetical protein [Pseudomonas fluorescens]VVO51862.1 hypothetical protein PS880_00348 [Pseudomonas fluorescens]
MTHTDIDFVVLRPTSKRLRDAIIAEPKKWLGSEIMKTTTPAHDAIQHAENELWVGLLGLLQQNR